MHIVLRSASGTCPPTRPRRLTFCLKPWRRQRRRWRRVGCVLIGRSEIAMDATTALCDSDLLALPGSDVWESKYLLHGVDVAAYQPLMDYCRYHPIYPRRHECVSRWFQVYVALFFNSPWPYKVMRRPLSSGILLVQEVAAKRRRTNRVPTTIDEDVPLCRRTHDDMCAVAEKRPETRLRTSCLHVPYARLNSAGRR